ncbi:MAG: peptidylprolyl isomerase [Bryobacteraceae bacterium]
MKKTICIAIFTATVIWAQALASSQAQPDGAAAAKAAVEKAAAQRTPAATMTLTPAPAAKPTPVLAPAPAAKNVFTMPSGEVWAIVDGKDVTAGEVQSLAKSMGPQVQQQIMHSPKSFLEQYGMMRRLAAEAVAEQLDQRSPGKEALESARANTLATIMFNSKHDTLLPTPEELKKRYDGGTDNFKQAKLKAIYIPFSPTANPPADDKGKKPLTEPEAKAKAEDLVKQIKAGADFVKLVKENSEDATSKAKDGDFGTMRSTDKAWPDAMKTAVLNTEPGKVTDPQRQASGYYIFRVEELGPQPFDEVKGTLSPKIQQENLRAWMKSVQDSVVVKMAGEAATSASQPPSAAPAAK